MASKKSSQDGSDMTMKVVVFLALLAAFGLGLFVARARYKPQLEELTKMSLDKDAALQQMKAADNKIMMKEDKMWIEENSIVKQMDADIMLPNGEKVTTSGKIIKADGTTVEMHNGDSMDMNGKMMPSTSTGN